MVRYRGAAPATLRTVPLDEVSAVYHRPSGQTHLLVEPAPQILEALAGEALDADALLARLAERFDVADPDRAALVARLEELVESGLVERA